MADTANTSFLDQIETEARKVPPLRSVLLMLTLVFGPFFLMALVMAAIERVDGPVSEESYALGAAAAGLGMIAGVIGAAFWWGRYVTHGRTAGHDAEKAPPGAFRSGLGMIGAHWRPWYTAAAGFAASAYVVFKTWGDDDASRDRFWEMSRDVTILGGVILAIVALCIWLGRRVQQQRAAR